jgi:hypothetical protein
MIQGNVNKLPGKYSSIHLHILLFNNKGLFFGHKHTDEFYLIRDDDENGAVKGVVLLAPSVVPNFNPAIRIYELDDASFNLVDYEQYFADLPTLNKGINYSQT